MQFGKFDAQNYKNSLVVTDKHIASLYGITGDNVYFLPQGESAKSFDCVKKLCSWFLQNNLAKTGQVVAVGGGSIGDTVGFACSIYKRGVNLLHVPTTLLAMVDSSIGGKTAIDLDGVKNAVGSFYKARTLVDVSFLKTLSSCQITDGLGEITKYRMLDKQIDEIFAKGNMQDTIKACIEYKQGVCDIDPFDDNLRKKLNFGHTIAHAMELALGISHGVAVLNGIFYETKLACKLGLCSEEYQNKWTRIVSSLTSIHPISDDILTLTLQDKKNTNQSVCFVLPTSFECVNISLQKLIELYND